MAGAGLAGRGRMMTPAAKPKPRKRRRSVASAAQRYEQLKADIIRQSLSPTEYARACLVAARRAGL